MQKIDRAGSYDDMLIDTRGNLKVATHGSKANFYKGLDSRKLQVLYCHLGLVNKISVQLRTIRQLYS